MSSEKVFVVYSHRNSSEKDALLTHLSVLRSVEVHLWSDDRFMANREWLNELKDGISEAQIAILLITADLLTSDLFMYGEFSRLLDQQRRAGLLVLALIARACPWKHVRWLAQVQVRPRFGEPVWAPGSDVDGVLSDIVLEIGQVLEGRAAQDTSAMDADSSCLQFFEDSFVFISHDHDDGDVAELLKLRLQAEELSAWIDTDRLRVGEDWRQEIDEAIEKAYALIVLMTPGAKASEYVTYEWAYAWGLGKKVIPVMCKFTQLHPRLEALQYLDFTNRRARPWDQLYAVLRDTMQDVNRTA